MNSIIKINDVTKFYGGKCVFDRLSLNIPEGKVIGLLGPNGVGKSTLLKMLVGLVKPNTGEIHILDSYPSYNLNKKIAYLPDRASWYLYQTVQEAINYVNVLYDDFDVSRGWDMLKQMKLDKEMKIKHLSRGQQACLYLVLCLARKVPLCILDEPFSGIDLISRERIIQGIIDSVMDQDQTIIISTHEIYEAESLFEEVFFLDNGNITYSGNVEYLRSKGESLSELYRRLYR